MDFVVPKGVNFNFNVYIKDTNSFLARDLTTMASATFTIFTYVTSEIIVEIALIPTNSINGILTGYLTAENTAPLVPYEAPPEDRSYLKSQYHATIQVLFDDEDDVTVYMDQVYVVPIGE